MIDSLDIDLLTESVTALITRAQSLIKFRRHCIISVEVNIAADSEMLGANQLRNMIEMVEQVFDRRRFIVLDEHPHTGDAYHAAGGSDLLDCFVALAPRMTGSES